MHFYFFCGTLPPENYFTKYCLAKVTYWNIIGVTKRVYLVNLVVEGSIKKIKFSSSLPSSTYLKTIGWEPI